MTLRPRPEADWRTPAARAIAAAVVSGYHAGAGEPLLRVLGDDDPAEALYRAPWPVLAHDGAADPVFVYANLAAQACFAASWPELVGLASRLSAPPEAQAERTGAIAAAEAAGWRTGYSGVRVDRSGRRFRIADAVLWRFDLPGGGAGLACRIGRTDLLDD